MRICIVSICCMIGVCLVPFIFVWLFMTIAGHKKKKKLSVGQLKSDAIFQIALHRSIVWWKSTILWMVAEYLFVIIPFVSNVVVIYLTAERDVCGGNCDSLILILSIISLSFVVFAYAINPQRHKKCYRKAYTILDLAINCYIGNANSKELCEKIHEGEKYIDDSCDVDTN